MIKRMKMVGPPVLLLLVGMLQMPLVQGDDSMKREIEAQIAAEETLKRASINVHVDARLVVLTGEVRLYEQKLTAERIAWKTMGVLEVDNEIRVVPKVPLADAAIERKIREILKSHRRFHGAEVEFRVENGVVFVHGNFLGIRDASFLKHKVAEIEGVVSLNVSANFLASSDSPRRT